MLTRWIDRRRSTRKSAVISIVLCGLCLSSLGADEPQPLHVRINNLIAETHVGPTPSKAGDAEFVRRVYLDLIGRVPTVVETRGFLQDAAPDKRSRLVDDLVGRDEINRHLAIVFDVWMMERHKDQHVTTAQWRDYLYRSFAAGKSYDQLAREILMAKADDEALKPAAKFYLDRNAETHSVTRDVSRIFFGRDIQCAQCHDHPLITDYVQAEYYGLFAFLNRSFLFQDEKDKKKVALAERAEGEAEYSSVFEPDSEKATAIPALSDGIVLDDEPQFLPGERYRVKPGKNVRPVPAFSRRQQLADLATGGDSESFKRNIANRLWRHMLGRGLVEPPDLHHPDNPAVHPELLQLLSNEFARLDFDVKAFLREVALTDVYQRAIDPPTDLAAKIPTIAGQLGQLKVQVGFQESVVQRASEQLRESSIQLATTRRELRSTQSELKEVFAQIAKANKTQGESAAQLAKLEKESAEKKTLGETIRTASQAAAKAAEQLKDDAELVSAARTFDERFKKLKTEVAALKARVAELKVAHEKNVADGKTLTQRVPPLENKRARILRQIRHRSGAQLALRRQLKAEQDRHLDLTQRISAIEQVMQFDSRTKNRLAIAARVNELTQQLRQFQMQNQAHHATQRDLESKIAQIQNSIRSDSKLLQMAEQSVDSYRTFVDAVQEAARQTELAVRSLATDADLAEAHQALAECVQQLTFQSTQLEKSTRHQETKVTTLKKQFAGLESQLEDERVQSARVQQQVAKATKAVEQLRQQQAEAESLVDDSRDSLKDLWKERIVVTSLKPLTPEQMANSLIRTLGLDQRYQAEAESEWEKNNKDKKEDAEPTTEQREQQIAELYKKREKKVVDACVSLFASSPGSPQDVFHATIDQALFFANDGRLRDWLRPTPGSLSKRLSRIEDGRLLAEELYLSVLSREPSDEEMSMVVDYLGNRTKDRAAAQQELVWSMLTSLEFRFNH